MSTRGGGGPLPWLYHHYVGHDNNRDWYMVTQQETRLVTDLLYRRWFPEVFYDVHQQGSDGMRITVPPLVDPINDPKPDASTNEGPCAADRPHNFNLSAVMISPGVGGGFVNRLTRDWQLGLIYQARSGTAITPSTRIQCGQGLRIEDASEDSAVRNRFVDADEREHRKRDGDRANLR